MDGEINSSVLSRGRGLKERCLWCHLLLKCLAFRFGWEIQASNSTSHCAVAKWDSGLALSLDSSLQITCFSFTGTEIGISATCPCLPSHGFTASTHFFSQKLFPRNQTGLSKQSTSCFHCLLFWAEGVLAVGWWWVFGKIPVTQHPTCQVENWRKCHGGHCLPHRLLLLGVHYQLLFFVFSPASTAGTEAEEEAPGAINGSVQRGQSHKDAQSEAFGRASTTGWILS